MFLQGLALCREFITCRITALFHEACLGFVCILCGDVRGVQIYDVCGLALYVCHWYYLCLVYM